MPSGDLIWITTMALTLAPLHRLPFCRCSSEQFVAGLVLAALIAGQIAALGGHPPRLGPSLNGVRRAATQLSRKLIKGEARIIAAATCYGQPLAG